MTPNSLVINLNSKRELKFSLIQSIPFWVILQQLKNQEKLKFSLLAKIQKKTMKGIQTLETIT